MQSLKRYKKATSHENWEQDYTGDISYKDPQKAIDAINSLIQFTDRK